jgi:hypothetical protein
MPVAGRLRADVHLAGGGGGLRYSREEYPRARNSSCRPARTRSAAGAQLKQCLDARTNTCCGFALFAASNLMDVDDRRLIDQLLAGRRLEVGGASIAQVVAT